VQATGVWDCALQFDAPITHVSVWLPVCPITQQISAGPGQVVIPHEMFHPGVATSMGLASGTV
jgi:hypothetical protein